MKIQTYPMAVFFFFSSEKVLLRCHLLYYFPVVLIVLVSCLLNDWNAVQCLLPVKWWYTSIPQSNIAPYTYAKKCISICYYDSP